MSTSHQCWECGPLAPARAPHHDYPESASPTSPPCHLPGLRWPCDEG